MEKDNIIYHDFRKDEQSEADSLKDLIGRSEIWLARCREIREVFLEQVKHFDFGVIPKDQERLSPQRAEEVIMNTSRENWLAHPLYFNMAIDVLETALREETDTDKTGVIGS